MTDSRSIAFDATFMIFYIGFTAAMAVLSVMLIAFYGFDVEFGEHHIGAALLNVAGWVLLPFAPRLYRRLVGQPFSWRANGALGGQA